MATAEPTQAGLMLLVVLDEERVRTPAAGLAATPPPPTRAAGPAPADAPEALPAAGAVVGGAAVVGAVAAAVVEAGAVAAGVLATRRGLLESPSESSTINNTISASATRANSHHGPRLRVLGQQRLRRPLAAERLLPLLLGFFDYQP